MLLAGIRRARHSVAIHMRAIAGFAAIQQVLASVAGLYKICHAWKITALEFLHTFLTQLPCVSEKHHSRRYQNRSG